MFAAKPFPMEIITVLNLSWMKNKSYASPRPFYALSFRIRGDAVFTHKEQSYHAKAKSIIYVPANYDYTIHSKTEEEIFVVHFQTEEKLSDNIEIFDAAMPEIFQDLFSKMLEAQNKKSVGYAFKLSSLFLSILEQMALQSQVLASSKEKMLQTVTEYIQSNFRESDLSVDKLASVINVSSTYLRILFKELLATSPHKYLTDVRLDYATGLLRSGYYSVCKAAELSGFEDPKYFSALYKKLRGKSPSEIIE